MDLKVPLLKKLNLFQDSQGLSRVYIDDLYTNSNVAQNEKQPKLSNLKRDLAKDSVTISLRAAVQLSGVIQFIYNHRKSWAFCQRVALQIEERLSIHQKDGTMFQFYQYLLTVPLKADVQMAKNSQT